jgi:hypothetical protein
MIRIKTIKAAPPAAPPMMAGRLVLLEGGLKFGQYWISVWVGSTDLDAAAATTVTEAPGGNLQDFNILSIQIDEQLTCTCFCFHPVMSPRMSLLQCLCSEQATSSTGLKNRGFG